MRKSAVLAGVLGLLPFTVLTGCSAPFEVPTNHSTANAFARPETPPRDGDVISLKKVNDSPDGTTLYEMFYESGGQKVQAYLEVPYKAGKYPLWVGCHGGWTIPEPDLKNVKNTSWPLNKITYHPPDAMYLYPEYQGYGDSGGTVQGVPSNVEDIQNAIVAANKATPGKSDGVYLYGQGIGAGAAMLVASQRNDVKAVIAYDPFLGYDAFATEYNKLGKPQSAKGLFDAFSKIDMHSALYQDSSVANHISTIQAPVLMVHNATGFPFGDVPHLVAQMQQLGKTVKYVELSVSYPDGTPAMYDWFTQYGFPENDWLA
jgi:hypothetical protein